jgi:long-chain acyl-CoA synthetase
MNIATNLDHAAFHFPNHPVITEGSRSTSFSEFNQDVNQIASARAGVGVQPGDHMALCAPNSYAWLVFYFSILKASAVAVTFSHLLTKDERSRTLADCEPKVLFTSDEKLGDLGDCRNSHIQHWLSAIMGAFPTPVVSCP